MRIAPKEDPPEEYPVSIVLVAISFFDAPS